MNDALPPLSARERHKEDVRTRILDSLMALLSEGVAINHDRVAERAGVARRTVYRYFPDHDALMQPLWDRVVGLAGGAAVRFPASEEELTSTMPSIYEGFDRIADLATIVRSTPQGRAVRLAQKGRRRAAYVAATADAVKELPAADRKLATAMLQVLHTTPWLEMRDQWDMEGAQIATACRWAVLTLLKDLRARGDRPLGEGPA
ncbi:MULTISPECIES: TetR/AcrR family transcriptional regulator [unclassified Sphingomonas]|uniref:TetR/AcrR family transcriptional regulator n=1 Tax=unclassified Sphingomonas TaxID=196159 RepID=UPI0006F779D0|nr:MULTISPECIES: TetR/AcrR family transcriptional regulator [unclassified Sphingomonas]KQX17673.1 resolvase [Sphingomonas sp. Root1294]KQY70599.1 resolvase [Sphingomonas sp. Root50]KRB91910.1 resolvase [Sphingomonas sp. Root720]